MATLQNIPEQMGKSPVLYMCHNCLTLLSSLLSKQNLVSSEGRDHQWFSKWKCPPHATPALWFFRLKVLSANSLGYTPPHSTPVWCTKSCWSHLTRVASYTGVDCHLQFSLWDHLGEAAEDSSAQPIHFPKPLTTFTSNNQHQRWSLCLSEGRS